MPYIKPALPPKPRRPLFTAFTLFATTLLGSVGCGDPSPADTGDLVLQAATTCDPDDQACLTKGAARRPRWQEQPDRVAVLTQPIGKKEPDEKVKAGLKCDVSLLGKLPENLDKKGPDLQNVSTNFHLLQSLELFTSLVTATIKKIDTFKEAKIGDDAEGSCVCKPTLSCVVSNPGQLKKDKVTFDACGTYCNEPSDCRDGRLSWLPNDVLKSPEGAVKFALKLVRYLDNVQGWMKENKFLAALDKAGVKLKNIEEVTSLLQCWIDQKCPKATTLVATPTKGLPYTPALAYVATTPMAPLGMEEDVLHLVLCIARLS